MTCYLRADNPAGLPVPWAYARRALAARWGCRPWEVDEAPAREVALELRLSALEADAAAWQARRGPASR